MSTVELRRKVKKEIDKLPAKQLASVVDFIGFLSRPSLADRLLAAEKDIRAGKGVNWRKVRRNV